MANKTEPITYQQAVTTYFGGTEFLAKSKLPWKCLDCGEGVVGLQSLFAHVRKEHHEKIRKPKTN